MKSLNEAKKQILVVEDEGLIAADLQKRLERLGYSVPMIARSGEEALLCARSTPFDLVLMDIRIQGDKDGIDTAQELKSLDMPVVYVGWSLEYEMYFYLATALLMALTREVWRNIVLMFSALAILGQIPGVAATLGNAAFFTDPMILEFVLGVIVGYLFVHGRIGDGLPNRAR